MNDFCYTTKQHTNKSIEYYINLHVTDKKKKRKDKISFVQTFYYLVYSQPRRENSNTYKK